MNELRNYYLNAMGIDRWFERKFSLEELQTYQYELFLDNTLLGFVFAESKNDSVSQIEKENELLQAIFQAFQCQLKNKREITGPSNVINGLKDFSSIIIYFGHLSESQFSKKCWITYSLATLLERPLLKCKVWQSLKKILKK